jgi:hypothetical protein
MFLFEKKLTKTTIDLFTIYSFKKQKRGKTDHVLWREYIAIFSIMKRIAKKINKTYLVGTSVRYIVNRMLESSVNFPDVDSFGRIMFFLVPSENHSELYTLLYFIKRLPQFCPETNLQKLHVDDDIFQEWKKLSR